jgi:lipid-binding SYLF domain-containing protein
MVLDDLTTAPDKGIPQELLAKADCILIFPSVAKGALIVGGKGGHGIASCRQPNGMMGSPAFYTVGGASIGFQIGGQTADVVMLIEPGTMSTISRGSLHVGGETTATARPGGTLRRRLPTRRCTLSSSPGPVRAGSSSAPPSTVRS